MASPNGLSVSRDGKWLYANQTFFPAQISRIEIADPTNVQVYVKLGAPDIAAGLDGMTRDRAGNLYVAANGGGWVGRVATRPLGLRIRERAGERERGLARPRQARFFPPQPLRRELRRRAHRAAERALSPATTAYGQIEQRSNEPSLASGTLTKEAWALFRCTE